MLNSNLLPSKFSIAVIDVPCMELGDLYIDYLLYNKETKLYTVPVSLSESLYKETHKDNIHTIILGANIVNYIPIHGSFTIKPTTLSNIRGCSSCKDKPIKYKQPKESYYDYSTHLKDDEAFLYCVKLTNKETNESFYKVGVTVQNIYTRLSTKYFDIQPIIMYKSDIKSIYELEQSFHYIANQYSYRPVFLPNGVTECYSLSYNIPKVVHQLVCV